VRRKIRCICGRIGRKSKGVEEEVDEGEMFTSRRALSNLRGAKDE